MKKKVKSWNGNPEQEPDYKKEVKSFSIIADVSRPGHHNLLKAVCIIIDLSESWHLKDVNFDNDGYTIYADIVIDDPACYPGNFDKLKSYFGSVGDIFCLEQENHFETMADIFRP